MDLTQSLKLGIKILHQGRLVDRLLKSKEHRQIKRNDLVAAKRHITTSPFVPSPEMPKNMQSSITRLEMLKKWQQERNKRKAEEKSKEKPLFKVCHVSPSVYKDMKLPPVSGRKEATPSLYKFATSTHKFRVPPNIKPIHFNHNSSNVIPKKAEGNAVMGAASHVPVERGRRKLNFKQENILPSKKTFDLDTADNKDSQNVKVNNRKKTSVLKTSEPVQTKVISSARGSKENLNMVSTRSKAAREISEADNKGSQNVKVNNRKKPSVPKTSEPDTTSEQTKVISSARGSRENLNMVSTRAKSAREISNQENLRPKSTRLNSQLKTKPGIKTDLVMVTTKKLSKLVEKCDVPRVQTRAMSSAQQETQIMHSTADVQKFKEGSKAFIDNAVQIKSPEFVKMTNRKTPGKTPKSGSKVKDSDSELANFSIDTSCKSKSPAYSEISFKAQLNVISPAAKNLDETTPDNKTPLTYVSPYVTMSRGKDSARKEYRKRLSKGGLCEASPEVTGVKAGSAYFYKVLDDEILRIQNICQEWTTYKDENDLPEEACDMINTALGQSGLLISKRMNQFRGLIDSCDAQNTDPLITCMDLHGYWDLLLIQVKNLDSRFDNLVKLRSNDWEEVLPEKKTIKAKAATKKQPGRKARVKPSSSIRDAIKAARLKVQNGSEQQNVFDGGFFAVKSPRKSGVMPEKVPLKDRGSLLKVALSSDMKKLMASPGLAMCRATRRSRSIGVPGNEKITPDTQTPGKSILKSKEVKSSVKKAVLFEADIDDKEETKNTSYIVSNQNNENDANSPNILPITDDHEPARRSSRLSRNRLF